MSSSNNSSGGGGGNGMATEGSRHTAQRPVSLDDAVQQLLHQQADIQSKLADLLPATYRHNVKLELSMLRHKLRALHAYVHHHEQLPVAPVLCEAEEARSLQYRCECIEAAILDQGLNLTNPTFIDALKRPVEHLAPVGYAAWLDQNLARYDPVFRTWSMRATAPSPSSLNFTSFKCLDEDCPHYIYGFSRKDDRNDHARGHDMAKHRDSGLSIGDHAYNAEYCISLATPLTLVRIVQNNSNSLAMTVTSFWGAIAAPSRMSRICFLQLLRRQGRCKHL
ncbi:hypothetical protein VDGE_30287 [Verticillium dahliae]|uniref:C2H2-type domain-containing protein n=1 Tax=Verticillium dahliae TaxID=27337 RepID=A0A444RYN3_VERDA|nr:hypothetical protein VDGE_30287 [Verticillium dahliae]